MDDDKDKESRGTTNIVFCGSKVEEWFKFDRQVLRWVRKKYGDSGVKLWNETAIAIDASSVDAIAQDTYESIADSEGFKEADRYYDWDHFWSVRYQGIWRKKTLCSIRDYVEERTSNRAFQHMIELTPDELPTLRSGLQLKFAKATPTVIRSMEQEYEAGIPEKPGAQIFPKGINIEEKVEQLEDRKRTLWFLCPEGIRANYLYGKEPKLVRIVLNHLSSEYRHDVNRMLDIHKVQLQFKGKEVPSGMEIEGYSDEWLPAWKTLRETLLKTAEALRNDSSSSSSPSSLPTMFTASNSNNAKHGKGGSGRQCYACGEWGHIRGDPECNAKVGDTHSCAPSGSTGWGRGRGNSNRGNGRGRGKGGRGQGICFHFANHGNCRHGQACKWKHEKGNSKGNGANATVVESVMATIRSKLQSQIAKKQNNRKKKGKGKKRSRHSSDEEDSDSNSEDDTSDSLFSFLTTATKSNRKGNRKGKKERLGMTVLVGSDSCSNSSSAKEATTKGSKDGGSVKVMAELHSKGVSGWDTDASRAVTTYVQYMIPSLLDRSKAATQSISFSSAAGTNSVLGIGPKARATIDTEDGKAYWVIEPDAVLMDTGPGGNDMSVYSAQSMKRLGLALQQCYKNTDRDVVVCRKTGRVVNLSEENGILVLRTVRRQATDLSRMPGIEDLVNDIRDGLISPLVPCSLKRYRSKNSNSSSTQLTLHAQFENRGKGSEEDLN